MTKKYMTVVFEYEQGANLPVNLTTAFSSNDKKYEDVTITAISLEDKISKVELSGGGMSNKTTIFPLQPIVDGRFVPNKIVEYLLDNGGFDMNMLAILDFPVQDRIQFAQLIGYSVGGFGTLGYVHDEYYSRVVDKLKEDGLI